MVLTHILTTLRLRGGQIKQQLQGTSTDSTDILGGGQVFCILTTLERGTRPKSGGTVRFDKTTCIHTCVGNQC